MIYVIDSIVYSLVPGPDKLAHRPVRPATVPASGLSESTIPPPHVATMSARASRVTNVTASHGAARNSRHPPRSTPRRAPCGAAVRPTAPHTGLVIAVSALDCQFGVAQWHAARAAPNVGIAGAQGRVRSTATLPTKHRLLLAASIPHLSLVCQARKFKRFCKESSRPRRTRRRRTADDSRRQ